MKKLQTISFVLIAILIIFLIKIYFVHPSFSDENIYFAMGKLVSEGKKPYYDFNFVHPPIQLYIYSGMFSLLGTSFYVAKLVPLISSSMSVLMIFLISKKLFGERSALLSSLFFIFTPAFLAFSDQGYGMWESIFFLLLTLYLSLEEKYFFAGMTFSVTFFIRYLSFLFFPFILILLILKKLEWKKLLIYALLWTTAFFAMFYSVYGYNFIDQTIVFQIFAKTNLTILPKLPFQYLEFGFFSIFLAAISTIIAIMKKDKILTVFSLYPVTIDILIFFGFTTIIYHYFLISLAILFIGIGRSFIISKDKIIQFGMIAIMIASVYQNISTINYYQNPSYANQFYTVADFVSSKASTSDRIFGESSITSYIMFEKNIPISSNYLDSFISYLVYRNETTVVANLEKEKPKIIIDMDGYYGGNLIFNSYISQKYTRIADFPGIPTYIIYQRKP